MRRTRRSKIDEVVEEPMTTRKRQRRLFDDEIPTKAPKTRAKSTRIAVASPKAPVPSVVPEKKQPSSPILYDIPDEKAIESEQLLSHFLKPLQRRDGRVSIGALKWCIYEWFYSSIDKGYFNHNEFQECLNELGLGKVTCLTRVEWAYVRTAIGKPRRFSQTFLKEEREKLEQNRENIRRLRDGKSPIKRTPADVALLREFPQQLSIGDKVHAIYKGELHKGIIKAVDFNSYKVALQGGDTVVLGDTEVMPHEGDQVKKKARKVNSPRTPMFKKTPFSSAQEEEMFVPNSASKSPLPNRKLAFPAVSNPAPLQVPSFYTNADLRTVATLLRLLEAKEALLHEIQKMNAIAAQLTSEGNEYPPLFQQQYAWLILHLENTNKSLEPALIFMSSRKHQELSMIRQPSSIADYSWYSDISEKCKTAAIKLVDKVSKAKSIKLKSPTKDSVQNSVNSEETDMNRSIGDEDKEKEPMIKDLISSCVGLMLHIQTCAENNLSAVEVSLALDAALQECRPKVPENRGIFRDIESAINTLKTQVFKIQLS